MSTVKLIVSDLHLADGTYIFEGFGDKQQAAFDGLLQMAMPQAETVELIINGDCFDFLVTRPYAEQRMTDEVTAAQKIEKIIAAHAPFFAALRAFLQLPGRSVTFTVGNHDLELFFTAVRERICSAITGEVADTRVYFCLTRCYRPLPDVHIEHGNHFDFWNHTTEGLWDERGNPLTAHPHTLTIPIGSWFFACAMYLISLRYPYIDHFEPGLSQTRKVALLSLLDPELVREVAQCSLGMMSQPRAPLANLVSGEEHNPVRLFEEALLDFVALRSDLSSQRTGWHEQAADGALPSPREITEYMAVHAALSLPRASAIAAICTSDASASSGDVTRGLRAVLAADPTLRYALAGHTHMLCHDQLEQGMQTYLNTASWVACYALPDQVTPDLLAWLQQPDWHNIPLRETTQLVFALITNDGGSSSANLYAWEGGGDGYYRILG